MSTYHFRCGKCGMNAEVEAVLGAAPRSVPHACGGEATRVFGTGMFIGAGALPNKRHGVRAVDAREKRWDRDMPAYKRLRMDGLQPPTVDGSGDLEATADIQFELETGKLFPKEEHSRIREAMAITKDIENAPGMEPDEWRATARETLKKKAEK